MMYELAPVVWHDEPEAILERFWGAMVEEVDGLESVEFGGLTDIGEEVVLSLDQMVESIRREGAWGYFDELAGEVHAWLAFDCDMGTAVHMLAHEFAHVTGLDVPGPADLDDERRAEIIGAISRQAYELAAARLRGEGGGE